MDTIRETLKRKFGIWLDQRCDKGLDTYGHELDDCPDDKFDWRDMLIEELLDGLQYQEKEIRRLKEQVEKGNYAIIENCNLRKEIESLQVQNTKMFRRVGQPSPFEIEEKKAAYADLDD